LCSDTRQSSLDRLAISDAEEWVAPRAAKHKAANHNVGRSGSAFHRRIQDLLEVLVVSPPFLPCT